MGTRIASVWKGEKYITGKMKCAAGINIPAGHEVTVAIVKNDKKQPGDRLPDYFLEIWDDNQTQN